MILNELSDPKGPENIIWTMMIYRETFYGRHTIVVVVVALLFYVQGKHLRSCRDGQLT